MKISDCGVLSFLELELARLRLDDEARLSHNFSAILGMSESFPDVDVVLAVLGRGEVGSFRMCWICYSEDLSGICTG